MLNQNQYERLKPYRDIIVRIGSGTGNSSNRDIPMLMNNIWVELKHSPKDIWCSHCVGELYQNIKDEILFYEEKYGKGESK